MAQLSKENKLMRGFRDAAAMTPEEKEIAKTRKLSRERDSFSRAAPWIAGASQLPTSMDAQPAHGAEVVSPPVSAKVPPDFARQVGGRSMPDREVGMRGAAYAGTLEPQPLTSSHLQTTAVPAKGVSYGASYDTGRAFTQAGDQVNFAGPNGMRQSMSLKQFHDQMNPTTPAPSNGIRRVGNLDITVDPSVPASERERGLGQMMGPAGTPTWDDYHRQQQARYDAYVNAPRGRFFGARPLDQDQSGLLTRENAPAGMGWQERKALNEQIIQNRQSGINAELQAEVTREGLRPTAQEQIETEAAQIGLRSAQRIESALRDYETADTPEKKAAALERYRLLTKTKEPTETKPEIRTESIVENGVMRDRTVAITVDKDGNITKREVPEAGGQDLRAVAADLTPDQRSKAAAYIKAHPTEDKATIISKAKAGEL